MEVVQYQIVIPADRITLVVNIFRTFDNLGNLFYLITLSLYVALFIYYKKYLMKDQCKNQRASSTQPQNIYLLKVMMMVILFGQYILKVPSVFVFWRNCFSLAFGVDYQNPMYLNILIPVSVAIEILVCLLYKLFLTSKYPIQKIPWAMPNQNYSVVLILQKYMILLSFSLPFENKLVSLAYGASFLINLSILILTSKEVLACDQMVQKFLLFQQAVLIVSSLFLYLECMQFLSSSICIELISFILLLTSIFMSSLKYKQLWVQKQIFNTHLKSLKDARRFMSSLIVLVNMKSDASPINIQQTILQLLCLADTHVRSCKEEQCHCKSKIFSKQFDRNSLKKYMEESLSSEQVEKCHRKISELLLSILNCQFTHFLKRQFKRSEKNEVENIQSILFYLEYRYGTHHFKTYFQIQKLHDCKQCSFINCYMQHQLKQIIASSLTESQSQNEEIHMFEASITYEKLLRQYTSHVLKMTKHVSDYWDYTLKHEVQLKITDNLSHLLLGRLIKITSLYQEMKVQCGDILSVELLKWRLYKDVLCFEEEAQENLINLHTIIDKSKILKKNMDATHLSRINSQYGLVVVSASPNTFHQITMANKYLLLMTGFDETDVFQQNLNVLLPIMVAKSHEKIVMKFVDTIQTNSTTSLKDLLLRNKDDTIQHIKLEICPKTTIEQDLILIGVIPTSFTYTLFEEEQALDDVFFLLANDSELVLNYSKNCATYLCFNRSLIQNDIRVDELFPTLDKSNEDLYNSEVGVIHELDSSQLMKHQEDAPEEVKAKLNILQSMISSQAYLESPSLKVAVKIHCKVIELGEQNTVQQYTFTLQSYLQDSKGMLVPMPTSNFLDKNSKTLNSVINLGNYTSTFSVDDLQSLGLSSVSSASNSSSDSSSLKSVLDIKSKLDFEYLPLFLKKFRILIIVVFLLLLFTTVALFIVNYTSTQTFIHNADAVRNMKIIRGAYTVTKLMTTMLKASVNIPSKDIENQILSSLNVSSTLSFYGLYSALIPAVNTILHDELSLFSSSQQTLDGSLVDMINNQKIVMEYLDRDSSVHTLSPVFFNAVQTYIAYLDSLTSANISDIQYNLNIFDLNSRTMITREDSLNKQTTLQQFFFCNQNSAGPLHDQFWKIDNTFMAMVYSAGDNIIHGVMLFTMLFSIFIFLMTFSIIPFFLNIDSVYLKALKFYIFVKDDTAKDQITKIKAYKDYILENRYISQDFEINGHKQGQQKVQADKRGQQNQNNNQLAHNQSEIKTENLQSIFDGTNKKNMNPRHSLQQKVQQKSKFSNKNKKNYEQDNKKEERKDDDDYDEYEEQEEEEKVDMDETKRNILQQGEKDKQTPISVKEQNSSIVARHAFIGKVKKVISVYIVSGLFCLFYFLAYIMSKSIYSTFQQGFYQFGVHYARIPCIYDSFFYVQFGIIRNSTFNETDPYQSRLTNVLNECQVNEQKYQQIKYEASPLFKKTHQKLSILDSDQACQLLLDSDSDPTYCYIQMKQYLDMDSMQFMAKFLTELQQKQAILQDTPMNQRTPQFNAKMFYDPKVILEIQLLSSYIILMFKNIYEQCKDDFLERINTDFDKISSLYGVFIVCQIVMLVVCQYFIIQRLKCQLLRIKLILKLIPSSEIVLLKQQIGDINTKQF